MHLADRKMALSFFFGLLLVFFVTTVSDAAPRVPLVPLDERFDEFYGMASMQIYNITFLVFSKRIIAIPTANDSPLISVYRRHEVVHWVVSHLCLISRSWCSSKHFKCSWRVRISSP
jgi:hypothetical protein